MHGNVALVGAGQAGGVCALALRKRGFKGRISLYGSEEELPYERPSLSKEYLSGEASDLAYVASPDRWRAEGIEFQLGTIVRKIDRFARTISVGHEDRLEKYDHLVLATGGDPKRIPGLNHERVCYLRSARDSRRISKLMSDGGSAVIIGAGVIGLEIASTLRKAGLSVTVIEASSAVMSRVLPPECTRLLEPLHLANGVDIRKSTNVLSLRPFDSGVVVQVSSGSEIEARFCVVGIGIVPNDQLGRECGLLCDDGVVVDDQYRSVTDPAIFAVGDVARKVDAARREESWTHAQSSGEAVAQAIVEGTGGPRPISYFWTTQFGRTLQVAGDVMGNGCGLAIGDSGRLYLDETRRAVGVAMLDGKRDFQLARKLVVKRALIDPAMVNNGTIDVKAAVKTAEERS